MNTILAVNESLQEIAKNYIKSPFNYLYESDIRCILYADIFHRMRDSTVKLESRTIGSQDPTGHLAINPVKSEYPSGTRFDIAIIEGPGDKARRIWNHRVNIAIEVKLWQIDGTGGGVLADLSKLAEYRRGREGQFLGISLLFCQPTMDYRKYLKDHLGLLKPTDRLELANDGLCLHVISADDGWLAGSVDDLHAN